MGREGSFIDNASAGGVVCGVDLRTGKVNSKGFDKEGALFDCHPDTGVRFEDLSMPDWEDAMQLVKQAALKLSPRWHMVQKLSPKLTRSLDPGMPMLPKQNVKCSDRLQSI